MSIILLNIHQNKHESERSELLNVILIFMMQFCLGGLFSASFLFYSKSGSVIASWPFLLMIFGYVIGNEILRKNYVRLSFQVSIFFTALFSYLIFFLPVVLGKMGDSIFIISGISSLILTGLFIYILSWFAPLRTRKSAPILIFSISILFSIINLLYFTNLIPPIPLALKEAGIYRSVSRLPDGTYLAEGEAQNWFNVFSSNPIIHLVTGEPLYALSAIFAPTSLKTNIMHVWQYYDEETSNWIESNKIELAIVGGRESGFRTYSAKRDVFPGKWRVSVETPRGQLVGRLSFTVAPSTGSEEILTGIK
jgi:hypothetical protein